MRLCLCACACDEPAVVVWRAPYQQRRRQFQIMLAILFATRLWQFLCSAVLTATYSEHDIRLRALAPAGRMTHNHITLHVDGMTSTVSHSCPSCTLSYRALHLRFQGHASIAR